MKRTKKLSVREYHPMKSTFSVQKLIQDRVNKEAWATVDIPVPPVPEYRRAKRTALSPTGAASFIRNVFSSILP